jgi:hypothetical protein
MLKIDTAGNCCAADFIFNFWQVDKAELRAFTLSGHRVEKRKYFTTSKFAILTPEQEKNYAEWLTELGWERTRELPGAHGNYKLGVWIWDQTHYKKALAVNVEPLAIVEVPKAQAGA